MEAEQENVLNKNFEVKCEINENAIPPTKHIGIFPAPDPFL
jgi:hypothetical protein